jgi:hypothetical protein
MHLNSILIKIFIYFVFRLISRDPVSEKRGKNQVDRPETRPPSSSADLQEGQAPSPAPEGAFSRRPGLSHRDAGDRKDLPGEKQPEPGAGIVLPPECSIGPSTSRSHNQETGACAREAWMKNTDHQNIRMLNGYCAIIPQKIRIHTK